MFNCKFVKDKKQYYVDITLYGKIKTNIRMMEIKMEIKLRKLLIEDKEKYWESGFANPDIEVMYYTGTINNPTKEQVYSYIERVVEDDSREDFIIVDLNNNILGEVVLNDIDDNNRSCGFRIAIFNKNLFGQGIGYKATLEVLRVAFEELKLHRVELEVFDYNPRAKRMYEKVGFKVEGVKREGIFIENEYKDVYIMAILEGEYREMFI